jgi:hypothetical protein
MAKFSRSRSLLARFRSELASLGSDAGQALREGRRPWAAVGMCLLSAGCAAASHVASLRPLLARSGDVYASLPVARELVRMPLSAFLPTADLPLWGALLQLAVVVGLAELIVGRIGTLFVALAGQVLSTLTSRLLVVLGTAVVIGLPLSQAGVLDTGPSGISTAVGGWMLARRGAYATLTLLVVAIAVAAALQANLDGREHATALLVGVGVAAMHRVPVRDLSRRAVHELRWIPEVVLPVGRACAVYFGSWSPLAAVSEGLPGDPVGHAAGNAREELVAERVGSGDRVVVESEMGGRTPVV